MYWNISETCRKGVQLLPAVFHLWPTSAKSKMNHLVNSTFFMQRCREYIGTVELSAYSALCVIISDAPDLRVFANSEGIRPQKHGISALIHRFTPYSGPLAAYYPQGTKAPHRQLSRLNPRKTA